MNWYLVSVLIFITFLVVIFYKDRKNVERQSFLLMRRTQRGKKFLINFGRRFPRFWKAAGFIAVVLGFIISIWFLYMLIDQTIMLFRENLEIGAGIVIPSLTQDASMGPGYFAVPFWYWIISIVLLVVVHEGMHGIMAAREKCRIKSLGWGLLAIIPLAFVEPDEKQLAKKGAWPQLRVFAAGSFGNFCLAGFSILLIASITTACFTPIGVGYSGLMEGYPANVSGMQAPGIITQLDDYAIRNTADLDYALRQTGPNQIITLRAMIMINEDIVDEIYVLKTTCPPEGACNSGFIGITYVPSQANIKELNAGLEPFAGLISFITGLFTFVFLLNFLIGALNLLPLGPLDGGRMYSIVLKKVTPRYEKRIMTFLSWFVLLLILLNFVMPFVNILI